MAFIGKILKNKFVIWLVVIAFAAGGYYWYRSTKAVTVETRYAFTTVTKDTVVSSVSGSGQVSGDRQLEIKPKVSAQVDKILVKVGDKVTAGTPLVELDRKDAVKTVRDADRSVSDAEISLQSARLSYQKAKQPTDAVTLIQAEDTLAKAQRDLDTLKAGATDYDIKQAQADVDTAQKNIKLASDGVTPQVVRDAYDQYVSTLQTAEQSLEKAYTDADSILGLDKAMVKDSLQRMYSIMDSNAKLSAKNNFNLSKDSIAKATALVDALKQQDEKPANIEAASTAVSSALTDVSNLLVNVSDGLQATLTSSDLTSGDLSGYKSSIDSDRSNISSKISSIQSQVQAIRQAKDTYASGQIQYSKAVNSLDKLKQGATAAELSTAVEKVKEAQAQVDKLKAGPDSIDLQISQNSVDQRVSALESAKIKLKDATDALNDYTVTAPFDGVVGKISTQEAADASAGTAVVTLLTSQQVATISLNEVDVAKVKVGQKATLTFDAVDGLTLTGEVAEVSQLGTVSQGVVNYDVKIAFDSQDERIKSGMSVSVSIVTQVDADVLTVPNGAVKTQGTEHYVETLEVASSTKPDATGYYASSETPKRVTVEVGLSNDTLTEITSGLTENQKIISQTIKAKTTTTATTASTNSIMRMTGAGGPGR